MLINRLLFFVAMCAICNAYLFGQIPYPPEPPGMPDNETNGKNVVFVHGYNVSEQEARGWASKMFKSLYQSGMRAKFHPVTWQGDEYLTHIAFDYHQNVVNAFDAALILAQTVNSIEGEKIIIAHSLGNMVVSAAIQDHGMVVDKYFALNSAVPIEAYDTNPNYYFSPVENAFIHSEWLDYSPWVWASRWHAMCDDSDWRYQLTWHGRFKDVPQRTEMYNYYSAGDETLEIYEDGTPSPLQGIAPSDKSTHSRYAWHKQETHKGRELPVGTNQMGWGFHKNWAGLPYYSPSQANMAASGRLLRRPVFRLDPSLILSTNAQPVSVCNAILAFGIPAISRPAGTTSFGTLRGVYNFDMAAQGRKADATGQWVWPRDANTSVLGNRWLHSDVKNVAYLYTHLVFNDIVEQGGLK